MDEDESEKIITPCTKKCVMNREGCCTGCLRDIREIADWAGMTNEERQRVIATLAKRKAVLLRSEKVRAPGVRTA